MDQIAFEPLMASLQAPCRAVIDKYFDDYATLQLSSAGAVIVSYDQVDHVCPGAWAWPHHSGPRIRLRPGDGGWWTHRHIAFRGGLVAEWRACGLWPEQPQAVAAVAPLVDLFDEFRHQWQRDGRWQQRRLANITEQILVLLADEREREAQPGWLRTIQAQLAGGRVQDFDAQALAARVGMGVSTLRRRFRAATGISLRDWAMGARMREAARRLHDSDQPVAAIAAEMGYCDAAAFSSQFRRHYRMTPNAYRALDYQA